MGLSVTLMGEDLPSKARLHLVEKFPDLREAGRLEVIGQLSRSRECEKSRGVCLDFNPLTGSVTLGKLHHLCASVSSPIKWE